MRYADFRRYALGLIYYGIDTKFNPIADREIKKSPYFVLGFNY